MGGLKQNPGYLSKLCAKVSLQTYAKNDISKEGPYHKLSKYGCIPPNNTLWGLNLNYQYNVISSFEKKDKVIKKKCLICASKFCERFGAPSDVNH